MRSPNQLEAERELAKLLYEAMEHLDPGTDSFIEWDGISERYKGFYLLLIRNLLANPTLLQRALSSPDTM